MSARPAGHGGLVHRTGRARRPGSLSVGDAQVAR